MSLSDEPREDGSCDQGESWTEAQEEVSEMFCTICGRMMYDLPGKGYVCPEHG